MSSTAQISQKLADVAGKQAGVERAMSVAQQRKASKDTEYASNMEKADRTSSDSTRRMYLRSASSAQNVSLAEGKKIADLSKKRADLAKELSTLNRSLAEAMKRDASAQAGQATKEKRDRDAAATKAKRDREADERKRIEQRRSDERRRQQERLEDEQRRQLEQWERQRRREQDRLDDLQETESMIGAAEQRLGEQIEAIRAPRREQLRILYATASSRGDLRVDEEIRRVKAVVNASTHRDQVRIEHLPAATTTDLLDGLTSFRPHVVHFSGHADEKVLVFDDGGDTMGPGRTVTAQAFKRAVEAPDEPPMLVVLNACKSAAQLRALLGKVPLGIGMSDSIGDVDALTFSTRFYRSIAEGQSVTASLAAAQADMELNGLPDHDLPVLLAVDGVDPSQVRLVIAPE